MQRSARDADKLAKSDRWNVAARLVQIGKATLHFFRQTNANTLIAAGLDVLTISRRLGHGSPGITLKGLWAFLPAR